MAKKKITKVAFRKSLAETAVININELMSVEMNSNARTAKLIELGEKLAGEARAEFTDVDDINKTFTTIRNAIRDMNVVGHLFYRRLGEASKAVSNGAIAMTERAMYQIEKLEGLKTKEIEATLKNWQKTITDKFESCSKDGASAARTAALNSLHESLGDALNNLYPATFYALVLSKMERDARNNKYSTQKESGMLNVIPININSYLELSERLLLSERWDDLAIGIAMATGRRMFEVLYSMSIEVPDSEKFDVLIDGLLKGGQKQGLSVGNGQVLIPVLVDPYLAKSSLSRLRGMENVKKVINAINDNGGDIATNGRALAVQLNRRAKIILSSLSDEKEANEWKFSDTRKMAWQAAYYFDKPANDEAGEDALSYAKRYLGHVDIGSTEHYIGYKFFDKKIDNNKTTSPDSSKLPGQILLEKLNSPKVDEAILKLASSGEFKEDTVINTHERLCKFLEKNPETKKLTKGTLQKQKKLGGVGAGHALATAYFESIKNLIK
ncbi:protelomerase family protein [Vibrio parahaemolyticus]